MLGGEWNTAIEYDPFWPNDYEKIMKERKDKLNSQTTSIKTTKISKANAYTPVLTSLGSRPLVDAYSDDDDENDETKNNNPTNKYNAIAPPASLNESTSQQTISTSFASIPPPATSSNTNALDVAARIMAKMGYKEGKGLGQKSARYRNCSTS